MPELPEVETVRKALIPKLKDKKIMDLTILHNNVFKDQDIKEVIENIKNQEIKTIERRGKWLKFVLEDYYLLSHLRMEGKYLYRDINSKIDKHELVIFNINNEFELRYKDVRKFGKMYLVKKEEIDKSPLNELGLEPFDEALTVKYLNEKYKNKKLPIKTVLLDQKVLTGIGNIYADEILFESKINPLSKAKDLKEKQLEKIIKSTRDILAKAIKEKGTTIRSYTSEEGKEGSYQNSLKVHLKENEPCINCNNKIIKEKVNGRSTYYCKNCQK